MLNPAEIYALTMIASCGRLYRFGACYRLDKKQPHQGIIVSARVVEGLRWHGSIVISPDRVVPGSDGYVQLRPVRRLKVVIALACLLAHYDRPEIAREWNEMPLHAMEQR